MTTPANNATPKWQEGIWTLTAPDGRTWKADSPLKAVSMEMRERVPPHIAIARIVAATADDVASERREQVAVVEALEKAAEAALKSDGGDIAGRRARTAILSLISTAIAAEAKQRSEDAEKYLWLPIETAPKDGTEILGWREYAGCMLIRYTCMREFMSEREIESTDLDEETIESEDWFYADFVAGGRLEGSETPTHWMPLPTDPDAARKQST